MKVIDLLNKIANGEDVPEYINYTHRVFGKDTMFVCKENIINKLDIGAIELNDEVEIIEEDKKIEKLKIEQDTPNSNFYIRNENGTKCGLTKHSKIIADKINEMIDYINKEK